jgi:hypothetical protein
VIWDLLLYLIFFAWGYLSALEWNRRRRRAERKIKSIVDEEAPRCSCLGAGSWPPCPMHGDLFGRR